MLPSSESVSYAPKSIKIELSSNNSIDIYEVIGGSYEALIVIIICASLDSHIPSVIL